MPKPRNAALMFRDELWQLVHLADATWPCQGFPLNFESCPSAPTMSSHPTQPLCIFILLSNCFGTIMFVQGDEENAQWLHRGLPRAPRLRIIAPACARILALRIWDLTE